MHSQTFIAVFALAAAVAAAPLPNQPSTSNPLTEIGNILGSPFGNGNGDGNGNAAGNGNDGNAAGDGSGDGNQNGNGIS